MSLRPGQCDAHAKRQIIPPGTPVPGIFLWAVSPEFDTIPSFSACPRCLN